MTYVLTLKENSFNNRFSTHRVSLRMVYNQHSCCILTEDVTTREGTRENKKMTLNRQSCPRGANLVLRFSRSGRREPEVSGAPGFILKPWPKKATGSGNENAKENLCPCAVRKQAPRQPAGSIFPSVRPLKWDALQTFSSSVLDELNSFHTSQNRRLLLHRKLWIKFDDCAIN